MPQKAFLALKFLESAFSSRQIPYLIIGGLAANLYGASRPLADIDIGVPDACLPLLSEKLQPYLVSPLQHYQDELWDLQLITLNIHGQEIDIFGVDTIKVFNAQTSAWQPLELDLLHPCIFNYQGLLLSLIPQQQLIKYKQVLRRPVDIQDIRELQATV